jgi:hypothetical protein
LLLEFMSKSRRCERTADSEKNLEISQNYGKFLFFLLFLLTIFIIPQLK